MLGRSLFGLLHDGYIAHPGFSCVWDSLVSKGLVDVMDLYTEGAGCSHQSWRACVLHHLQVC